MPEGISSEIPVTLPPLPRCERRSWPRGGEEKGSAHHLRLAQDRRYSRSEGVEEESENPSTHHPAGMEFRRKKILKLSFEPFQSLT
jgi:hypothetical protein